MKQWNITHAFALFVRQHYVLLFRKRKHQHLPFLKRNRVKLTHVHKTEIVTCHKFDTTR